MYYEICARTMSVVNRVGTVTGRILLSVHMGNSGNKTKMVLYKVV